MVNLRLAEFLLGIRIGRPWRCRLLASPLDYKALVARDGTAPVCPRNTGCCSSGMPMFEQISVSVINFSTRWSTLVGELLAPSDQVPAFEQLRKARRCAEAAQAQAR